MSHHQQFEELTAHTLTGRSFRIVRGLLLLIMTPLFRLQITGVEHVPLDGPILVVANHLHNADPVLVSVALPRPLHFMAKKELFSVPVLRWIVRRVGAFPVDRGRADRSAFRRAEATLHHGIAVGMFPEGTRSTTNALAPAHPGAGLIALRSGAPVLPVVITGSERLPGNGVKARKNEKRRWRGGIKVQFGPPFCIIPTAAGRRLSGADASDIMMKELARLLPSAYRGEYDPGSEGERLASGDRSVRQRASASDQG